MSETFGDTKKHQIVEEMYDRLRRVVEVFCRSEAKNNVLRAIQNFVPHLKRTDRDVGALPLYSDVPTSRKTNREHCLLCVLSYAVQKFWDYRDPDVVSTEADLLELLTHITFLEKVAKLGLAQYRVHGKYPKFSLVHVDDIAQLENEEEAADQELAARMKQENIEATKAERTGGISPGYLDHDSRTDEQIANSEPSTTSAEENADHVKNAVEVRADKKQTVTEAKGVKDDAAMVETADQCGGDCDTCTDRVCDKQLGSPEEQAEQTAALKELLAEQTAALKELLKDQEQLIVDTETTADGTQDDVDDGSFVKVPADYVVDDPDGINDESGEDTGDEGEGFDTGNPMAEDAADEEEITKEQQADDAVEEKVDQQQEETAELDAENSAQSRYLDEAEKANEGTTTTNETEQVDEIPEPPPMPKDD